MTVFLICLAAAVLVSLIFVFIIAPGRPSPEQKRAFFGNNIAHRGLFSADQSVPENSLPAFRAAREAGYGVELDVQLSADGEVVVFHDDTLFRVCGVNARVDSLTLAELKKLSLFGTNERIPLFSEVLEALGGGPPLIVELKNGKRNADLCDKTLRLLKSYKGDFCIESFNPFILRRFKKTAPGVLRGQLAQPPRYYKGEVASAAGFILGNLLFNFLARPQFIAYRIGKKPLSVRLCEKMGALRVGWTGHDAACEKDFDTVIFEHYRPKTVFKE